MRFCAHESVSISIVSLAALETTDLAFVSARESVYIALIALALQKVVLACVSVLAEILRPLPVLLWQSRRQQVRHD